MDSCPTMRPSCRCRARRRNRCHRGRWQRGGVLARHGDLHLASERLWRLSGDRERGGPCPRPVHRRVQVAAGRTAARDHRREDHPESDFHDPPIAGGLNHRAHADVCPSAPSQPTGRASTARRKGSSRGSIWGRGAAPRRRRRRELAASAACDQGGSGHRAPIGVKVARIVRSLTTPDPRCCGSRRSCPPLYACRKA